MQTQTDALDTCLSTSVQTDPVVTSVSAADSGREDDDGGREDDSDDMDLSTDTTATDSCFQPDHPARQTANLSARRTRSSLVLTASEGFGIPFSSPAPRSNKKNTPPPSASPDYLTPESSNSATPVTQRKRPRGGPPPDPDVKSPTAIQGLQNKQLYHRVALTSSIPLVPESN